MRDKDLVGTKVGSGSPTSSQIMYLQQPLQEVAILSPISIKSNPSLSQSHSNIVKMAKTYFEFGEPLHR